MKYFIKFLANVGKNSGANRMGARNLALVFGASLLNPPAIDQYDLENIKQQCSVVEHMITSYSYIFEGSTESDGSSQKLREKQVATIPAGNPGSNLGPNPVSSSTQARGENPRKSFMKRKSTFFANAHGSSTSSRISDMIIPITSRSSKASDSIDNSVTNDDDKKDKKKKKKHRKNKSESEPFSARKKTEEPEDDSDSS